MKEMVYCIQLRYCFVRYIVHCISNVLEAARDETITNQRKYG